MPRCYHTPKWKSVLHLFFNLLNLFPPIAPQWVTVQGPRYTRHIYRSTYFHTIRTRCTFTAQYDLLSGAAFML